VLAVRQHPVLFGLKRLIWFSFFVLGSGLLLGVFTSLDAAAYITGACLACMRPLFVKWFPGRDRPKPMAQLPLWHESQEMSKSTTLNDETVLESTRDGTKGQQLCHVKRFESSLD
jgi:hypothetical protein